MYTHQIFTTYTTNVVYIYMNCNKFRHRKKYKLHNITGIFKRIPYFSAF